MRESEIIRHVHLCKCAKISSRKFNIFENIYVNITDFLNQWEVYILQLAFLHSARCFLSDVLFFYELCWISLYVRNIAEANNAGQSQNSA